MIGADVDGLSGSDDLGDLHPTVQLDAGAENEHPDANMGEGHAQRAAGQMRQAREAVGNRRGAEPDAVRQLAQRAGDQPHAKTDAKNGETRLRILK